MKMWKLLGTGIVMLGLGNPKMDEGNIHTDTSMVMFGLKGQ